MIASTLRWCPFSDDKVGHFRAGRVPGITNFKRPTRRIAQLVLLPNILVISSSPSAGRCHGGSTKRCCLEALSAIFGAAGPTSPDCEFPPKMRLRAVLSRQKRFLDVVKTLQKIAKTCTIRISSEDVVLAVNPGSLNEPQVWSSLKSVFPFACNPLSLGW